MKCHEKSQLSVILKISHAMFVVQPVAHDQYPLPILAIAPRWAFTSSEATDLWYVGLFETISRVTSPVPVNDHRVSHWNGTKMGIHHFWIPVRHPKGGISQASQGEKAEEEERRKLEEAESNGKQGLTGSGCSRLTKSENQKMLIELN